MDPDWIRKRSLVDKGAAEVDDASFPTKCELQHEEQPYSTPRHNWGKGLLDSFLEISTYTVPCFVLADGAIGSAFTSKYPGTRKNTSLGIGDWHFFPCVVYLQTLNFIICGFHPYVNLVAIVHCFVEAQSVGIAHTCFINDGGGVGHSATLLKSHLRELPLTSAL